MMKKVYSLQSTVYRKISTLVGRRKTVVTLAIVTCLLLLVTLLLATNYKLPTTYAATVCGNPSPNPRAGGLVTTPSLSSSGKFGTTGGCIVDSKAALAPYKCPNCSYADLRSFYYYQSKLPKPSPPSTISSSTTFSGDNLYLTNSDPFQASGTIGGSGTQVIFVNGSLNITANLIYHTSDASGGLVFIVQNDINIDPAVTQIDAVLISSGTIFTAGASCVTSSVQTTNALTINGSLIALGKPIKFCRKLSDNNLPAEIINHQPKYLVLLRNLISDTVQQWTEVP